MKSIRLISGDTVDQGSASAGSALSGTPHGARRDSSGWLPQLDGLRGISILMVLTAHVYAPGWHELQGGYGVTVFFVLSGFLITRLLLREELETGKVNLTSFYVRRGFRLLPLYYLVLGVYCVLIFGLGTRPEARAGFVSALPFYLFYLQEIVFYLKSLEASVNVPFYQSWSLGIEEKFYLLWPILAFRVLRNRNARISLAAGAVLLFSAARFIPHARYLYLYMPISWGCLFALLDDVAGVRSKLLAWISSWRAAVVLLSWPALHVLVAGRHLPTGARLVGELTYPLSIAFVILASLGSAWLARIFSFAPLALLGRYSYCIYLIHLLVRNTVERVLQRVGIGLGNGVLVYVLMLVLSTAGASILYYVVESPFREVGRRISRSLTQRAKARVTPTPARLGPNLAPTPPPTASE